MFVSHSRTTTSSDRRTHPLTAFRVNRTMGRTTIVLRTMPGFFIVLRDSSGFLVHLGPHGPDSSQGMQEKRGGRTPPSADG